MKHPHSTRPWLSIPLLLLLAACGGAAEVDISTITNETAHQAATEIAEEAGAIAGLDTLPDVVTDSLVALQERRQLLIQQALKDSRYSSLRDASVDSMRHAWLAAYARSCEPGEFNRIMDALGTDEVLKQWAQQNVDSAIAYHGRLMAAKKACGK